MDTYDIKRLALVLALQAEIEAMKAYNNSENPMKYPENRFWEKAEELRQLANKHNEQL